MANLGEYNYKVDVIGDGVSVDGENSFFTYVVDPNPTDNVSVATEDLFIFVRLRAFPQNRSVITSDNVFSSNDQDLDGVYFIASEKQNDKGYLTTNYTNIGGLENTVEGLGIKNISITTAMLTPAIVEINFVDVRGAAVFNNYENFDGDHTNNTSKFNSFFRLPYPIFELTVKGYYGKAVTYHLNLQKFTASVDTASGDFIIKCNFIGYEFAFLSDIVTKYVIALNNTELGRTYLTDYLKKDKTNGLLSIPQLIQKYTEIATYTEDFKKSEGDYELLKILNTLYDKTNYLQSVIGSPSTLSTKEYGEYLNYENLNTNYAYLFFRDVGLFSNRLDSNLVELEANLNDKITEINNIISSYSQTYPILNDLKISNFSLIKSIKYPTITDVLLDDIQTIISANEQSNFRQLYDLNYVENKLINLSPYFLVSFYNIRKIIYEANKKNKDQKLKYEEEIVTKLNKTFVEKIGFNPTVFNVFEIIFGNVDIFLEIIYEVCKKADSLGEARVSNLRNYFNNTNANVGRVDVPYSHNRIYPFPAVYDLNGEQIWLGDVVGENNQNFPELKLINGIISGVIGVDLFDSQSNSSTYSQNTDEKWVPISPVDYTFNFFDNADIFNYGDPNLSELYESILSRALILYEYSVVGGNKFLKYSEFESAYFISKVKNESTKVFLQNIDVNQFVIGGLNYYANNVIPLLLNNYDFQNTTTKKIFYIEEYPDVFSGKVSFNNKNLSANINKILSQKSTTVDTIVLDGLNSKFKTESNNYAINVDLTLCYNNSNIEKTIISDYTSLYGSQRKPEVPYANLIKSMKLFDGDLTGVFSNDKNSVIYYKDNAHLKVGKSFTQYHNGESLFDQFYYTDNNIYAKALLFLKTIDFKGFDFFKSNVATTAATYSMSDWYIAYIGGLLYHANNYYRSTHDILTNDIKNHPDFYLIQNDNFFFKPEITLNELNLLPLLNDEIYSFFVNSFTDFISEYSLIETKAKNYVDLGALANKTLNQNLEYEAVWDILLIHITNVRQVVCVAPTVVLNDTVNTIDTVLLQQYLNIFCNTFKKLVVLNYNNTNNTNNNTNGNNLLGDKNVKIKIYNDIKNIYDKWLSYSSKDGKIYNFANYIKGGSTTKKLIDHCYFIDRTWSDIGDLAVLNPKPLLVYTNQTDGNIYSLVSRVLKDNNFNFYNIPSFVNYYNKADVSAMFKPYTTIENSEGGACFIFQYVAGNSKILDLNERVGYFNDGFDLKSGSVVDVPKSMLNRKIPNHINGSELTAEELKDYLAKYNLCVFRVAYADQNQNIFEKIEVSQEEHRETGESMLIQDEIAGGKGGTKRIYMGVDLYNLFAVRSYKTDVECMGNMQILPTQYFQLDNIPLFHGVHMITSVKHYIEPHNIVTSFSGRRISKFSYPIVDKMTTFLNLELNEKIQGPDLVVPYLEEGGLINGTDYGSNDDLVSFGIDDDLIQSAQNGNSSPSNPTNTDAVVFTVIKNNATAMFVLSSNVNSAILQSRLNGFFKTYNVETFGLPSGTCATWVRKAFLSLGVVKTGNAPTDAWNWFMGLPNDQNMYYFKGDDKFTDWSFEDLSTKGVKNGSLIFGYFVGSKYKQIAYNAMKEFTNNQERIKILTDNKRIVGAYDFTPVTHIGIYYNGVVYDLTRGVTLSPHKSFVPVAFYNFLPKLIELAKKNDN